MNCEHRQTIRRCRRGGRVWINCLLVVLGVNLVTAAPRQSQTPRAKSSGTVSASAIDPQRATGNQLSATAPAVPAKTNITLTLGWNAFTNTVLFQTGATNLTRTTNGADITERITVTNRYAAFKPVQTYTLWLGTNALVNTYVTSARVSFPRGTAPSFDLRANLTDGQSLLYGSFAPTTNAATSLLLNVDIEKTSSWLSWAVVQRFATVLTDVSGPQGFYRANLTIEPFGTNAGTYVFTPNLIAVTNQP